MKQDLYLIIPAGLKAERILESFNRFCKDETPQAVLYDPANHTDTDAGKIIKTVQNKDIAVIIRNSAEKALSLQADGVQIAYDKELKKIKKQIGDLALGVICTTRDEAMRAGEAGADYIGFDGENAAELTLWWSELFTLPCVDFNPDRPSEAADFRIRELSC
ncbi:MAG: thiamine phosphate synthase [Alphaproteobacteria bacterium]|nr:thiamine phosphate synthase [Alphaproteobacteria bacterium]MBO4643538.1 thiamine phosphate synthase [Alphaproteobacteria bacterium]